MARQYYNRDDRTSQGCSIGKTYIGLVQRKVNLVLPGLEGHKAIKQGAVLASRPFLLGVGTQQVCKHSQRLRKHARKADANAVIDITGSSDYLSIEAWRLIAETVVG